MVVIADTSPLTALLYLKELPLLYQLYGQVYIPAAVAAELQSLTSFGYDLSFLEERERYIIRAAADKALIETLSESPDTGEAEAIALAKELQADLLLIDAQLGKEAAEAIHIACKGVVGVLIEAKHAALIPLVKPLLDDLMSGLKFRLSDHIYQLALKRSGE